MNSIAEKADTYIDKFHYTLPENLIARYPAVPRDSSGLLVVDRKDSTITHRRFYDLPELLDKNSLLVLNDTRVFPARVYGKKQTGGKVEILLTKRITDDTWEALSTPGLDTGAKVTFPGFEAEVLEKYGKVIQIKLKYEGDIYKLLEETGTVPVPPYIKTELTKDDLTEKYQTVYARETGSAAAPTAGLHFTANLFSKLEKAGIGVVKITLHVSLGTFAPLEDENIIQNKLHSEYLEISADEAKAINEAKRQGKKIIAVGTTALRALESVAGNDGQILPFKGETSIFIKPGYKFRIADGLITNFHLPSTSLLMLVTAFTSFPNTSEEFSEFKNSLMGKAYVQAVQNNYRFYSFGDACLIK